MEEEAINKKGFEMFFTEGEEAEIVFTVEVPVLKMQSYEKDQLIFKVKRNE